MLRPALLLALLLAAHGASGFGVTCNRSRGLLQPTKVPPRKGAPGAAAAECKERRHDKRNLMKEARCFLDSLHSNLTLHISAQQCQRVADDSIEYSLEANGEHGDVWPESAMEGAVRI